MSSTSGRAGVALTLAAAALFPGTAFATGACSEFREWVAEGTSGPLDPELAERVVAQFGRNASQWSNYRRDEEREAFDNFERFVLDRQPDVQLAAIEANVQKAMAAYVLDAFLDLFPAYLNPAGIPKALLSGFKVVGKAKEDFDKAWAQAANADAREWLKLVRQTTLKRSETHVVEEGWLRALGPEDRNVPSLTWMCDFIDFAADADNRPNSHQFEFVMIRRWMVHGLFFGEASISHAVIEYNRFLNAPLDATIGHGHQIHFDSKYFGKNLGDRVRELVEGECDRMGCPVIDPRCKRDPAAEPQLQDVDRRNAPSSEGASDDALGPEPPPALPTAQEIMDQVFEPVPTGAEPDPIRCERHDVAADSSLFELRIPVLIRIGPKPDPPSSLPFVPRRIHPTWPVVLPDGRLEPDIAWYRARLEGPMRAVVPDPRLFEHVLQNKPIFRIGDIAKGFVKP